MLNNYSREDVPQSNKENLSGRRDQTCNTDDIDQYFGEHTIKFSHKYLKSLDKFSQASRMQLAPRNEKQRTEAEPSCSTPSTHRQLQKPRYQEQQLPLDELPRPSLMKPSRN